MAIQNITGKKLNANEPTLLIQVKMACSTGFPNAGINVRTSWLLNELPIPNMIPQNESSATGSIKVLPNCWKNSHNVIFGVVLVVIKRLLVKAS